MRILDAFCCAGGAGMGYHQAGFEVVGVDIEPQPHYPFPFIQADALEVLRGGTSWKASDGRWYTLNDFDAIHASPPCQKYSIMTNGRWQDRVGNHPDLISNVQDILAVRTTPYVIENVSGARHLLNNPILLCGTMFGLQTKQGNQLLRHRYFECSFGFTLVPTCQHNKGSAVGVYGGGQNPARKKAAYIGVYGHTGGSSARAGTAQFDVKARREAMGIDWMTNAELSEAIPPAYTKFIGARLLAYLLEASHG